MNLTFLHVRGVLLLLLLLFVSRLMATATTNGLTIFRAEHVFHHEDIR